MAIPTLKSFGNKRKKRVIKKFEKDDGIMYTMNNNGIKGWGQINPESVDKIDLEKNIIYYKTMDKNEEIHYEQLFIFRCSMSVISGLLKFSDF